MVWYIHYTVGGVTYSAICANFEMMVAYCTKYNLVPSEVAKEYILIDREEQLF